MSEQRNGRVDELKFSWTRHGTNIRMVNIVRTSGYNEPAENRHSLVICGILEPLSKIDLNPSKMSRTSPKPHVSLVQVGILLLIASDIDKVAITNIGTLSIREGRHCWMLVDNNKGTRRTRVQVNLGMGTHRYHAY
jgi:hypothetical protein